MVHDKKATGGRDANGGESRSRNIEKKLRDTLSEKDMTQAKFAAKVRVSPNTINQIAAGKFQVAKGANERRRRLGQVESLTRLAAHLKVNIKEVLGEFGVDIDGDIESAIARARREAAAPHVIDDPTLNSVRARGDKEWIGEVRVGLLKWQPFHGDNGATFAEQYTRRLIGNLNPFLKYESSELNGIEESINRLVDRKPSDDQALDLVFGLYETPARHLLEMKFLQVPGFNVQLGAIATSFEQRDWWDVILGVREAYQPKVVVIKDEIGQLFLRGPALYPIKKIVPRPNANPVELAEFVLGLLSSEKGDVAFVAEQQKCREVLAQLQGARPARKIELVETPSDKGKVPTYEVGIAVRGDAKDWLNLLQIAQADLFRNCTDNIARLYASVLARLDAGDLQWSWRRIDDFRDSKIRPDFVKIVELLLSGKKPAIEGW
jgi:transcriptional regulator with XRE-family HTH domain